jgi:hypothetical protein
VRVAA